MEKCGSGFNISLHVQIGFCFEVYVNMTVFVAWFNFNIFGCVHNLKQTYDSVLKAMALPGGMGRHLPLAQQFKGVN